MPKHILDECAQLQGFDLVQKMFSYGAGIGIRPWAVFQTFNQMNALGRDARDIILASAAVQSIFGIRDWESARRVSDMLGVEILDYYELGRQGAATFEARSLFQSVMNGKDAFAAAPKLRRLIEESALRGRLRRPLQTPDEVLNMASDRQFIFADGLPGAIYASRAPYYDQRFMSGRYHPSPFYPPDDKVRVQGRFRKYWRPVITAPVPDEFKDYPQYRDGFWSYIGE